VTTLPVGLDTALPELVETAHAAVVALDLAGRVEFANPHLRELTGLGEDALLGRDWLAEVVPASVREPVRLAVEGVAAGGGPARLEHPIASAGGVERILAWTHVARRDADGRVVGTIGCGTEVTDLRRAEAEARRALGELESQKYALDQHAIVAVTDRRGRITYVNRKFCELSGYAREELLGEDHRLINSGYHPQAFFRDMWATIGRGEVWRGEIRNRAKDGRLYWVDTTIVPVKDPDGTIVRFVAIRADVTDRKASEERLAELASIVEAADDAIVGVDLDGRIASWNPSAERTYGYTEDEARGLAVERLVDPDHLGDERAHQSAGRRRPIESVHRRRDGSRFAVSLTISPLEDADGKTVGWARISRDITEKKAMQEKLVQAAKLAALGELAGNIAHEVNNPIGIVSGKARLLVTGGHDLPAKVERELNKIVEQCERVGRLTRGLLDYCRPSLGSKAPLDVQEPLRKALGLIAAKARRRGVELERRLLERPPRVDGNANELEQVFLNLLLNAIDAMPGGGRLAVEVRRVEADGGAGAELELEVEVRDTGDGIDPEHVDRVFEPFFTTKGGSGTGLGLAICYGLIGNHGGSIAVESDGPGHGTAFRVRLPLAARPESER